MKTTTLILLFLSLAAPAWCQSAPHEQAARDFLEASNARQAIDATYDQLLPQLRSMTEKYAVSEEQRPMLDRYLEQMVKAMKEELSWEKMEPHLIRAYTSVYTEEELVALTEFYRSPLGQKFVSKMPQLMQASMKMVQDMLPDYIERIQEIQADLQVELTQATSASP